MCGVKFVKFSLIRMAAKKWRAFIGTVFTLIKFLFKDIKYVLSFLIICQLLKLMDLYIIKPMLNK